MTPYEAIRHQLPFDLYNFQREAVEALAPLDTIGLYLAVGCGKTLTSIAISLFKLKTGEVSRVICLMPPILLTNWSRVLSNIKGVTHTVYRGTPAKRAKLNLDTDFILMSYQIFKKDWAKLHERYLNDTVVVLCDEAQAIKNVGSDTHKKVRDFAVSNHLMLLTGTPLSVPTDGYAYIKLISPGVYRNQLQFENVHVAARDFFGKPTKFVNLDILNQNLRLNSVRVLKEDVLHELPEVTYTELYYDMNEDHSRLYRELAEQQLKVLDDGTKIDITQVSALYNALQQIPANAEHFSGGDVSSTVYDLIEEIMDELGDGKLVVFTKYKMTNRRMLEKFEKYGVRAVFGDISRAQQQANLDAFINDDQCRMILLQLQSASAGLDGMQHVCKDVLFIELPPTAAHFTQAVARVHRSGQKENVNVRVALAEKTIQPYIWDQVMQKDEVVNQCIRGPEDLRKVVMGEYRRKAA